MPNSDSRSGIPLVGFGARTPVGLTAPETAAAVRAGVAMMQDHPYLSDKRGEPMVVCRDAELEPEVGGVDRLLELAASAALEAVAPLLEQQSWKHAIPTYVALPENRPGRPDELEETFKQLFPKHLAEKVDLELDCCALGHAGGFICMENAFALIDSGKSHLCLVGGVDSYLEATTLEWLDDNDLLHSETTTWGFCPGEGAGFCLLASQALVDRLELFSPGRLISAGSAQEPNPINTETVCIGEGLSEAFQKTLARLPQNGKVTHSICDMTGEPYRGDEFGFAMLRSTDHFEDGADFDTPANCWGDQGAASGPLFAALAAAAAAKGYAPGPLTLLWGSSLGGKRAAALLEGFTPANAEEAG